MGNFQKLTHEIHDWDSFRPTMHNTVIFTIGNPCEGHGPVLSADNDSRCANFVAFQVSNRTGARFISHIPYTSDQVGKIALDWSPSYLQMNEFVMKSAEFIRYHCNILYDQLNMKFSKILIINGHGGNNGMKKYPYWDKLSSQFESEVIFVNTYEVDATKCLQENPYLSDESLTVYSNIVSGHADTMEHSIASLYGGIDYGKLYQLNKFIRKNGVDATLKKWPVLAGLGGYQKFGGVEYEPLRKIEALVKCLKQFEKEKQIFVFPDFAHMIMEELISDICQKITPTEIYSK